MQHSFDIDIAKEYGLLEAILLNNIWFWIEKNKANNQNYHDGCYWAYNSTKAFSELFPYVSQRQIQNALKKLIEQDILITGNYNVSQYDRTLWYAFSKKGKCIMQKCKMDYAKKGNGLCKNVKCIYNIDNNTDNTDNNIIDNKYDKYIISNEYIISKKKENKKDINIFLKERKIEYEKEFIDVWKLYPKKVGMQKSKEYYVNARIDGVDKETIVNGINAYVDFIKKENKDRKYIKDGSTWFHQKCWNDEYEEEVSTPQNVDVPDGYVLKGGKLWQK